MSATQRTGLSERFLEQDEAIAGLRASTDQLVALVRTAGSVDRPIPHLTWSVSQCVAHLVASNHMYRHQIVGPGASLRIEDTSSVNDWSVMGFDGVAPDAMSSDLLTSTDQIIELARSLTAGARFRWWSGADASVTTALGVLIGERLVHGWDIAQALREPWPISREAAALAMAASFDVMPILVDPTAAEGFNAVIELRLRGRSRFEFRFVDGMLRTKPRSLVPDADCRISADPASMLLVGYGRTSQWRSILSGQIVAWGRKPWVATRLQKVLRSP